tara:strand:- start:145 stop:282 length:138 start_codon:yes stop_codon:yes gene_type:complete
MMSEVVQYWLKKNDLTVDDLPPSVASHLRAAAAKQKRMMTKEGCE